MDWTALALVSVVVACAGAVQGSVGFGYSLIAAPLLALLDPRLVPGALLVSSMVLTAATAWRELGDMDVRGMGWALVGRVPGSLLGAASLAVLTLDAAGTLIAVVVLFAVAISVSGLHIRPAPGSLVGAGIASGFMNTVSTIGGPPFAILYQHEPGARLRSTLAGLFLVGGVVSIASLAWYGKFGMVDVRLGGWLVPGTLAGFALSSAVTPWLDRGYTRPAVLVTAGASGLALLLREAF